MTDEQVKRLTDIEEIKQLKARSVRLIDTKEWAAWGHEVLMPDFRLESDGGIKEGCEEVVASVSASLQNARTVHRCVMPEITITGPDTASAVWSMADVVEIPVGDSVILLRGFGHYHDEYVRTEEGWRIKSQTTRRLRVDQERRPAEAQ